MKLIQIIFLLIFAAGCYEPQTTTGVYKVTTETAAEIYYTDSGGDTRVVTTDGGEWIYEIELEQDHSPDPFWFTVYVISTSGIQDITIYVKFKESKNEYTTKSETDVEELEFNSAYCPPWTTKCAKVTINF